MLMFVSYSCHIHIPCHTIILHHPSRVLRLPSLQVVGVTSVYTDVVLPLQMGVRGPGYRGWFTTLDFQKLAYLSERRFHI